MAEPYVGEIRLFGGTFAPPGWVLCDGRELPIAGEYEALFQVIGTKYGGGNGTFAVPAMMTIRTPLPPTVSCIIAVAGRTPRPAELRPSAE